MSPVRATTLLRPRCSRSRPATPRVRPRNGSSSKPCSCQVKVNPHPAREARMRARPRAARAVLASAAITLLAMALFGVIDAPASVAQSICFPPSDPACQPTTTTTVQPTTTSVAQSICSPPSDPACQPPTPTPVERTATPVVPPAWRDWKWTAPADDETTVNDSTFRGTFVHDGGGDIDKIDMTVTYADPKSFP